VAWGAADGHDLLGNASRASTHTDTKTINTGLDQLGGLLTSDDVATNDIKLGEVLLDPADHLKLEDAVALGAVKDDNVEASLNKRGETLLVVRAGANGCGSEKLLGAVALACVGV